MADEAISQLPGFSYSPQLILPVVDLTRAAGSRNGSLTAGALLVAFQAAGAQGAAPAVNAPPGGIQVPALGTTDVELYVPRAANTDVLILALELKGTTVAAPVYNFQVYAGPPASANPALLYDSLAATAAAIGADGTGDYTFPGLLYVPAAAGSNQVWIRVVNTQAIPMAINARVVTLEFLGQGPVLGGFVPPPPYTGPLLPVVHVGPNEQFIEPQYGMQALADGGTMYVDAGIYYLPFGITWSPTFATHPKFGPNPNSARGGGRFDQGVAIVGAGTYGAASTVFNGRGGYGNRGSQPFRLTVGKGFLYANSPVLVQGVLFQACGGADNVSDGEAAVYAESFQSPGQCHVKSCAFDNNENGIFVPDYQTNGANVDLLIEASDFGYALPNGTGGEGKSHDLYVSGISTEVVGSHFYGDLTPLPQKPVLGPVGMGETPDKDYVLGAATSSGNCMKSRGLHFTATGCWVRNQSGKALDRPDGGATTINSTVFSSLGGSTNLQFGYNTEQTQPVPLSDVIFNHCTLYCSRNPGALLWNNTGPGSQANGADQNPYKFDWSNGTTQLWVSASASLVVNRNGSGYMLDQTACVGLALTPPAGTVFVQNPKAPPPASCPTGAVVQPLNP